MANDHTLDFLLDLDGIEYAIGARGHWVRFVVKQVPASPGRPHGLVYSLTLHDPQGHRLVGFDIAHGQREGSGPGVRRPQTLDHRHRLRRIRPYEFEMRQACCGISGPKSRLRSRNWE